MPEAIRLKNKYLVGFRSSQKTTKSGQSGGKNHHKLNAAQKKLLAPQPAMEMMLTYAGGWNHGKLRMRRAA